MIFVSYLAKRLYGLNKDKDVNQQLQEATAIGFLTQTNLTDTRGAKIFRMVVFYTSLIICYCGMVMTIMIMCNYNPENVVIHSQSDSDVIWRNLNLVQEHCLRCCHGMFAGLSWILDILCQFVSDNNAACREACHCTIRKRINVAQVF